MNESKITVRYAKSLFLLALEKNTLNEVKDDMTYIFELCEQVSDFALVLESPILQPSKKQKIITATIGKSISNMSMAFLDLLLKNKRENHLKMIVKDFIEMYKVHMGIKTIILSSTSPISLEVKQKISLIIQDFYKSKVEFKEIIDKRLIGGFILRIDDQQIDTSVIAQLHKIKQEFLSTTIQ